MAEQNDEWMKNLAISFGLAFCCFSKKGGHFLFLVLLVFDLNPTTLILSRFILAYIFSL